MNCITIQIDADRFASVLNGGVINVSRHNDYSLFHFKAHDVKALKARIEKFIFIDMKGAVNEIIETEQLKQRGINYKTAKRSDSSLTAEETADIAQAFELVEAFVAKRIKSLASATSQGNDVAAGEALIAGEQSIAGDIAMTASSQSGSETTSTPADGADESIGSEEQLDELNSGATENTASDNVMAPMGKKKRRH